MLHPYQQYSTRLKEFHVSKHPLMIQNDSFALCRTGWENLSVQNSSVHLYAGIDSFHFS